jgi:hypothetical protein
MDGHERELTKVKDNMYEIVNYLKASTETDIDAKIKDATDAILATP